MPYYLRIPWRNIFREKRRSFTLGANYAVVTIILVALFSFSEGARQNISSDLSRASAGHITISGEYERNGKLYAGVKQYGKVEQVIRSTLDEQLTILPRYIMNSSLYYKGKTRLLQFTGIANEKESELKGQIQLVDGSWDEFGQSRNAAIIPKSAADYFRLSLDDEVVLSARSKFGAFNTAILKVAGIYTTANFFIQDLVTNHFAFLRQLDLAEQDVASLLYVCTADRGGIQQDRKRLMAALERAGYQTSQPQSGEDAIQAVSSATPAGSREQAEAGTKKLTLSTLGEVLGPAGRVLQAVNVLGSIVAVIMMLIIAICVFINLRVTIRDRLQEIGTLRAVGFGSGTVTVLFVIENFILSLVFIAGGTVLALLIIAVFTTAVTVPSTEALALFLQDNHLVLRPLLIHIVLITVAVSGFGALFALFPARSGGRVQPVEAIREHV
jgi:putative ABC transport system permease protein